MITQHPLENTLEDFWRMVWEHNSLVIVNLMQADEMEQVRPLHFQFIIFSLQTLSSKFC